MEEATSSKAGRRQGREKNQEGSSGKCHEGTLVSEWWTVAQIGHRVCDEDLRGERAGRKKAPGAAEATEDKQARLTASVALAHSLDTRTRARARISTIRSPDRAHLAPAPFRGRE